MFTCHELLGFMPAPLALEIIDNTCATDKPTYHAALSAVAEARKVRPVFLLKKPRVDRHRDMIGVLASPRLEETGSLLLRQWLARTQVAMLTDFLNRLGIPHEQGVVEEFPATVEDAALEGAVTELLAKYPEKTVALYLHSLVAMKLVAWPRLEALLRDDARLQVA